MAGRRVSGASSGGGGSSISGSGGARRAGPGAAGWRMRRRLRRRGRRPIPVGVGVLVGEVRRAREKQSEQSQAGDPSCDQRQRPWRGGAPYMQARFGRLGRCGWRGARRRRRAAGNRHHRVEKRRERKGRHGRTILAYQWVRHRFRDLPSFSPNGSPRRNKGQNGGYFLPMPVDFTPPKNRGEGNMKKMGQFWISLRCAFRRR